MLLIDVIFVVVIVIRGYRDRKCLQPKDRTVLNLSGKERVIGDLASNGLKNLGPDNAGKSQWKKPIALCQFNPLKHTIL